MPAFTLRRLVAIAFLPSLAFGQGRTGNIKGDRAKDVGGRGFSMPRSSDLEDHTPVGVVLDKKKKLALTDSQVTALKAIQKQLKEKNASFYGMWDSTRVAMRSASAGAFGSATVSGVSAQNSSVAATPADEQRLATARTHLAAIMRALRENDEWSRAETLKVLTEEQKPKAEEYWKSDAEDFGASLRGLGGGPPGF